MSIKKSLIDIIYDNNKLYIKSKVDLNDITINTYNKSLVSSRSIKIIRKNIDHWVIPINDFHIKYPGLLCEICDDNQDVLHSQYVDFEKRLSINISGILNHYDTNYPEFQKMIDDYKGKVDIFVHTWYNMGKNDIDGFIKMYNPKSIIIEDYNSVKEIFKYYIELLGGRESTLSMFYSMARSNDVKEQYALKNKIIYDFCMRYRTDIELNEFKINECMQYFDDEHGLVIPIPVNFRKHFEISDILFIGRKKEMNITQRLFDELLLLNKSFNNILSLPNENILLNHIKNYNLKYNIYEIEYTVTR